MTGIRQLVEVAQRDGLTRLRCYVSAMLTPSRRPFRVGTAILSSVLALAACSSVSASSKVKENSDVSPLSFHGCSEVACTGELGGAAYKIEMPAKWNGTLLLWSHGYRSAIPTPPDFGPVDTKADDSPVTQADRDANTAHGQTVEPLPFHGMSTYPYGVNEKFPNDATHNSYREEYNIRPALRLIRPLVNDGARR